MIDKLFLRKYKVNNEGGIIYVDRKVYKWLNSFSLNDLSQKTFIEKEIYKQLTKSGFDENPDVSPPKKIPKISLILVLFNSKYWVDNLKQMLSNLNPWIYEIVVVDNGSTDNSLNILNECLPGLISIKNLTPKPFAAAINQGTRIASGDVFLMINPDVYIPKSSLWALIDCYQKNKSVAAYSPKLLLMKTPGFINGIGNIVKPFWHGYDMGLGHLDIGQFNDICDLYSACFATILIPRKSWEEIGELDEKFPLYYEDTDWCYRARNIGKRIILNPHAKIYHAYKASSKDGYNFRNQYIMNITKGRIRFTRKNINKNIKIFYLLSFFLNDIFNFFKYLLLQKRSFFKCLFFPWVTELFLSKESFCYKKSNWYKSNSFKYNIDCSPSIYLGLPVLSSKNLHLIIKLREKMEINE